MLNGLCHSVTWGSLTNLGAWGWVGLALSLLFLIGLVTSLTLVIVRALRRARVPTVATAAHASGQSAAEQDLQAQYAQGEITREQYMLRK